MNPINSTCPISGKSVRADAVTRHDDHIVGFCSIEHRDQFVHAMAHYRAVCKPSDHYTRVRQCADRR